MTSRISKRPSALPALLWLDGAFELGAALALFAWRGWISHAFNVEAAAVVAVGVVFLAAAGAVALIAAARDRSLTRILAALHLAGGALAWIALLSTWQSVEVEARWIGAATADTFMALGLLELLALRSRRG